MSKTLGYAIAPKATEATIMEQAFLRHLSYRGLTGVYSIMVRPEDVPVQLASFIQPPPLLDGGDFEDMDVAEGRHGTAQDVIDT